MPAVIVEKDGHVLTVTLNRPAPKPLSVTSLASATWEKCERWYLGSPT